MAPTVLGSQQSPFGGNCRKSPRIPTSGTNYHGFQGSLAPQTLSPASQVREAFG